MAFLDNHELAKFAAQMEPFYLEENPFLRKLAQKNRIMRNTKGTSIVRDYHASETSDFKSIGRFAVLDRVEDQDEVRATWQWGAYHASEVFDGLEMEQIGGQWQIRNQHKEYVMKLKEDMELNVQDQLWVGDGLVVGTGGTGRGILGVTEGIVASPSTGSYAGINRATYSGWRNQVTDGAAGPNTDWPTDVSERILTLKTACTRPMRSGRPAPDLLFGTRANVVTALASAEGRNTAIKRDIGEEYIFWGFEATIDDNTPTNTMYMINSQTVELHSTGPNIMQFTARTNLPDYHPKTVVYDGVCQLALLVVMPRNNGILTNAT